MDIKRIIHKLTNKLESLSLTIPIFLVGLGFVVLGVTLFPVIGIVAGVFIWWIAWRFTLSNSRKNQIKEALQRIKARQAFLSGAKSKAASEKQEVAPPDSDHR